MRTIIMLGLSWLSVTLSALGQTSAFGLATLGIRGGYSANDKSTTFEQVEATATFNLPWRWQTESRCWLQTRLACAAGRLHGRDDQGFIGTIGPCLSIGREHFPLHLDLGVSPTIMSQTEFGGRDFGIPLQFTSYAEADFDLGKHLGVGYRYQHMSNAHLGDHNPGLNLHAFSVCYRF